MKVFAWSPISFAKFGAPKSHFESKDKRTHEEVRRRDGQP